MNRYGSLAQRHWQTYLPSRYAQIEDPNNFFSTLGEEVAEQVDLVAAQLDAQIPTSTPYLDRVGLMTNNQQRAEETVLADLVYLEPEPAADPDRDALTGPSSDASPQWSPQVEDPAHPFWQQINPSNGQ